MKKKILILILTLLSTFSISDAAERCFAKYGCFPIPSSGFRYLEDGTVINDSPAVILNYYNGLVNKLVNKLSTNPNLITSNGYTGTVSITGKVPGHIVTGYFKNNVLTNMTCNNGVTGKFNYNFCLNGATNFSVCNKCPVGEVMVAGKCEKKCTNGATNPPDCNRCPAGMSYNTTQKKCIIQCPAGQHLVNNSCVSDACTNGTIDPPHCITCPNGATVANASTQCPTTCIYTNACGQESPGTISGGVCNPITPVTNNTCIQDFTVSNQSINPNGSVNFYWRIPTLTDTTATCGFVDLTTGTPRKIPGLQDLNESDDKATISNIQKTTRFCLVCQFKNTLTGATSDAVAHQWIKVIQIGEGE